MKNLMIILMICHNNTIYYRLNFDFIISELKLKTYVL